MFAILNRPERTARGRTRIAARPMRHQGRLTGSRLSDLAALGKAIVLCDVAKRKWNASRHGYVPHPTHPTVQGVCDATGVRASNLTLYIKENG